MKFKKSSLKSIGLILFIVFFIFIFQSLATSPTIISSRLSPLIAYTSTNIQAFCNASDSDLNVLQYNYTIYLNNVQNITGLSPNIITNTFCFQESPTVSNQKSTDGNCGLNYSGNYFNAGGWQEFGSVIRFTNLNDGDYTTKGQGDPNNAPYIGTALINYTKPLGAVSFTWNTLTQNQSGFNINTSVVIDANNNADCWNYNANTIILNWTSNRSNTGDGNQQTQQGDCLNSTGWHRIIYNNGMVFWEENGKWNISNLYSESKEQNVYNFSNIATNTNVTLECSASDETTYSTALNSSVLTILETTTCSYLSGTWTVQGSEKCGLNTTNLAGNKLIFNGTGQIRILQNITNCGVVTLQNGVDVTVTSGARLC